MRASVESFLSSLAVERDASPNTLAAYRRDLEGLIAALPNRQRASSVTTEDLRKHLANLTRRGLSARSVARHLAAFRSFFRFLRKEGVIRRDPCEGIAAARQSHAIPKVLSVQQVDALLASPVGFSPLTLRDGLTLCAMLEVLYATGARASEVVSLQLRATELALTEEDVSMLRVKGKGEKERIVPLGQRSLDALRDYITAGRPRLNPKSTELLLSRTGQTLTRVDVWRIVKKHLVKAGLDPNSASPHTLRHSFATHLVERGAGLRVVQEFLGHARVTTTQVYTHLDRGRLARIHGAFHPNG